MLYATTVDEREQNKALGQSEHEQRGDYDWHTLLQGRTQTTPLQTHLDGGDQGLTNRVSDSQNYPW